MTRGTCSIVATALPETTSATVATKNGTISLSLMLRSPTISPKTSNTETSVVLSVPTTPRTSATRKPRINDQLPAFSIIVAAIVG